MIDVTGAKIDAISLHRIGNKSRGEEALFATDLFGVSPELSIALLKFFLSPFVSKNEYYDFSHHQDTKFNEVRTYTKEIFDNSNAFLKESINIARHLYSVGNHPNIHSGELFTCNFSGINISGKAVSCIGIFKSETKDHFLTYSQNSDSSIIAKLEQGAQLNSLDKGVLVTIEKGKTEPKLLILDKKNADAQYWISSFLNAKLEHDDAYCTEVVINSCVLFAKSQVAKKVEKKNIISLNNYVVKYFQESPEFDADEFFDGVESECHEDFKGYVVGKVEEQGIAITKKFSVAADRVKKISKKIQNIIRLDTLIDLKVNGDRSGGLNNLEKGYDKEKGMYYYKVYFNQEIS